MHRGRVLLVVPDEDLSRSLAFALGTHGHEISAVLQWSDLDSTKLFDCIVVDERALRAVQQESIREVASHCHLILLSSKEDGVARGPFETIIPMPLRGEAVTDAVASALASRDRLVEPLRGRPEFRTPSRSGK